MGIRINDFNPYLTEDGFWECFENDGKAALSETAFYCQAHCSCARGAQQTGVITLRDMAFYPRLFAIVDPADGELHVPISWIARATLCSPAYIKKALKRLDSAGLITWSTKGRQK